MTIRQTLARAFFWLLLGAIILSGVLSFIEFRRSLQTEIADNLQFGAGAVMQRIDTFLFSQFENMRVWRRLEIMQDIRVGDVDKRLSHFLSELRTGQGTVFQNLFCTDTSGRVVSASDPAAIGTEYGTDHHWLVVPGNGRAQVSLKPVHLRTGDSVTLRTPIADAFGRGKLGYLYAQLNWREVLRLLDDAVAREPRSILLLDDAGRIIGASQDLRARGFPTQLQLDAWSPADSHTAVRDGAALGYADVLVGEAVSTGYQHFTGLGWRVLMLEPTRLAFESIWRMLWIQLGLLLLTLAVAVWISRRLAARIARPIVTLTEFTRQFREDRKAQPLPLASTITEVGELNQAFTDMIEALEVSREQIVRAGKLAVVGEMAAIMAHEVRTPLGILRTSAQLLEAQPDLGERERELIAYITAETERLNRLVTLLLECARPRPPEFRPHDLHDIIQNVVNLLEAKAEKSGVRLLTELEAGDPVLACDREQLTQVFLNLILNALDFVPAQGRIAVRTLSTADELIVYVDDDGPGVAAELRGNIFDPFFSRREGGIGLGLTIVQQIVEVHQGRIQVTESPWGGARFDIRFNRQKQAEG